MLGIRKRNTMFFFNFHLTFTADSFLKSLEKLPVFKKLIIIVTVFGKTKICNLRRRIKKSM
jgi:hypothetical protein